MGTAANTAPDLSPVFGLSAEFFAFAADNAVVTLADVVVTAGSMN